MSFPLQFWGFVFSVMRLLMITEKVSGFRLFGGSNSALVVPWALDCRVAFLGAKNSIINLNYVIRSSDVSSFTWARTLGSSAHAGAILGDFWPADQRNLHINVKEARPLPMLCISIFIILFLVNLAVKLQFCIEQRELPFCQVKQFSFGLVSVCFHTLIFLPLGPSRVSYLGGCCRVIPNLSLCQRSHLSVLSELWLFQMPCEHSRLDAGHL